MCSADSEKQVTRSLLWHAEMSSGLRQKKPCAATEENILGRACCLCSCIIPCVHRSVRVSARQMTQNFAASKDFRIRKVTQGFFASLQLITPLELSFPFYGLQSAPLLAPAPRARRQRRAPCFEREPLVCPIPRQRLHNPHHRTLSGVFAPWHWSIRAMLDQKQWTYSVDEQRHYYTLALDNRQHVSGDAHLLVK